VAFSFAPIFESFSKSKTDLPWRAAVMADIIPAAPEPMTIRL